MKTRTRRLVAGVVMVAVVGTGATVAIAKQADDNDVAITGAALKRASEAALAFTGGGRVTGTEVGDEDSYYEVEVTRDDGSQIDVQLDRDFNVVSGAVDVSDEDEGTGDD